MHSALRAAPLRGVQRKARLLWLDGVLPELLRQLSELMHEVVVTWWGRHGTGRSSGVGVPRCAVRVVTGV